jgi:hypothetical protein
MIAAVTLCIHEAETDQCADCGPRSPALKRATGSGTRAGHRFDLVHVPALRDDTFLHLNTEGDSWAIRSYPSPTEPAVVLARGENATDRNSLGIVDRIWYPHSKGQGGERVTNHRYWFGEIAKANAGLPTGPGGLE